MKPRYLLTGHFVKAGIIALICLREKIAICDREHYISASLSVLA
jgi:hypothetical protein